MMTNLSDSDTSAEFCYLCETHDDPGGCNLAAQTIASYIEDMLAMTASKKGNKTKMKILCLLDSVVKPGDRWLWNYLPSNHDEVDFLVTTGAVDQFQKWGKLLNYYPAFWQTGLRALLKTRRTHYDLVVAWQGKNGFPYAVLRSIVGQTSPPLIILGFSLQGIVSHFLGLVRFGLRSVSRVTVITPVEVESYRRLLSLSPEAICYIPFGWHDTVWRYQTQEVRK